MSVTDLDEVLLESKFKFYRKILSKIKGTAGVVYILEAEEHVYPRRIALKTINRDKLSKHPRSDLVARFKRELEKHYSFGNHPLVLRPFVVEIIRNWPYIALPYCDLSLRDYMDGAQLQDLGQSLCIAIQATHALSCCRSRGLVAHQDLKPENILLQDNHRRFRPQHPVRWQVRIADFGLANAFAELGISSGSRPYMAPEQHERHKDFTKVDVFALGVIFSELFGGAHPIGVPTTSLWPNPATHMRRWGHETSWKKWAKSSAKVDTKLKFKPGSVETLIQQMLATDPHQRPEMREVEADLVSTLRKEDSLLADNVQLLLDYFDSLAQESIKLDTESSPTYSEKQTKKLRGLNL